MSGHLTRFAASFGVNGLRIPERSPNTRAALALAEYARDQDRLHELRHAAMEAFWREGKDLEDRAVLSRCAAAAGLDPVKALAAIDNPAVVARVDAMGRNASRAGVTGIPTFLIGDRRVVGCQPYEVLAEAARAAGARPRHPDRE
jgi:predicted DsbA family dithiol-disulfide isomerase